MIERKQVGGENHPSEIWKDLSETEKRMIALVHSLTTDTPVCFSDELFEELMGIEQIADVPAAFDQLLAKGIFQEYEHGLREKRTATKLTESGVRLYTYAHDNNLIQKYIK